MIRETAGRAVALDPDTFTSPDSYEVARLAAGAAVSAVEHVLAARAGARALALVRPPGHHAERNRAMGFCLFNNIAIAAAHARARGLESRRHRRLRRASRQRHAVDVLRRSLGAVHLVAPVSRSTPAPAPRTRSAGGRRRGFTVNLPLAAGATDADYERVYAQIACRCCGSSSRS